MFTHHPFKMFLGEHIPRAYWYKSLVCLCVGLVVFDEHILAKIKKGIDKFFNLLKLSFIFLQNEGGIMYSFPNVYKWVVQYR